MIDQRRSPGGGRMSVEQIEHELGQLRMNEDGSIGQRASVLNLIVVTDDESASEVTDAISNLASGYPSRAIVLISDPDESEPSVEVELSAFCSVRGGSNASVCAEQITIHAGGAPAGHLESLAGPLLIPDLPVFLWYPGEFSPGSPEFQGMAELADRLIIDSAAAEDPEALVRELSEMIDEEHVPAIGDLQWVALSPWRSLTADLFSPPDRTGELERIRRVEVLHNPDGEVRALLLTGWLASALGWQLEDAEHKEGGREIHFSGPSGDVTVEFTSQPPEATLRRIRLYTYDLSFQVSRHRDQGDARSTVMRDEKIVGERTVHLGTFNLGVLVGEELQYRGHDTSYESALRVATEILSR